MPELRKIGEVQGRGAVSPLLDRQVTVQGVVVGNFSQGLGGVFLQFARLDAVHEPVARPHRRALRGLPARKRHYGERDGWWQYQLVQPFPIVAKIL